MSGGRFDYWQYHIDAIADEIEEELNKQGKEKPKEEFYFDQDFLDKYPEERYYQVHRIDVQEQMRNAINALRIAAIYAQRVDWYLSGDDGEDSFLWRLNQELNLVRLYEPPRPEIPQSETDSK